MTNRREFFRNALGAASGALAARFVTPVAGETVASSPSFVTPADAGYRAVVTPNGSTLPWKLVGGVKVYHLIAEPVEHEFAPGLVAQCWGYNGQVHGPTIEAVEGDQVRIYVTNRLSEPTTVHWHGLILPNGMDGVGGMTQRSIEPGQTFKYEFTLRQHGTFMYHPHYDEMTQMALGMSGLFIVHPKSANQVDHDFALMLSEWRIDVGSSRPNPLEMTDFNILTFNARCYPGTAPLVVKEGSKVRVRLGNLGAMDHHPIHLHGYKFDVTETEGGPIPESARQPESTVLVGVGQTRTFEFVADNLGDWALHCHMTHHTMNQMGHRSGSNVIGMRTGGLNQEMRKIMGGYMAMGASGMGDMGEMKMAVPKNSIPMLGSDSQFGYLSMGGMFTILKVRDEIPAHSADPGWYQNPAGTVATEAAPADLQRDGIKLS